MGEVQDPAVHIGTSVVNPHSDMLTVRQINDSNNAPEREGPMGRRHGLHIKDLSIGSLFAVKLLPVPGGDATVLNPDIKTGLSFGNPGTGPEGQARNCDSSFTA
jgi:hypothetical protein